MKLLEPLTYNRGLDFAKHIPEWLELCNLLEGISSADIERHHGAQSVTRTGAQDSANKVIANRLKAEDFESGPYVFPTKAVARKRGLLGDKENPYPRDGTWPPRLRMDFKKGHLGVEVQFNNSASLEHTVFKLNAAFSDPRVLPEDLILVAALVLASKRLKDWGRMDNTVRTFESVEDKLELVRTSLAVPLLVVGLDPEDDWPSQSDVFPGRGRAGRGR